MDRLVLGMLPARRLRGAALVAAAAVLLAAAGAFYLRPLPSPSAPARAPELVQVLATSFHGAAAWVVDKDSLVPNGPTGIYRTSDRGRTWRALPVPLAKSYAPLLQLFDAQRGVLVLLRDEAAGRPRLFATSSGGTSWRSLPLPDEAGSATGVTAFADPEHGWFLVPALGGPARLWRTRDAARTWQELSPPEPTSGRPALAFLDARHGLLAGAGLWATSDAGESWSLLRAALPAGSGLGAPVVAGTEVRVALTSPGDGEVLASHDGGDSWSARSLPAGTGTPDVALATLRDWYLVADSLLLTSHDGGASWTSIDPRLPRGARLGPLAMSGADGWSVGDLDSGTSVLLSTSDGGRHWSRVPLPRLA